MAMGFWHSRRRQGFYAPSNLGTGGEMFTPLYASPAKIHGSAQLVPQTKFIGEGVAILNFRLESLGADTGDLGKVLEPFADAFIPQGHENALIVKHIGFDLILGSRKHKTVVDGVSKQLRAARDRWVCSTVVHSRVIDTIA